MAALKGAFIKLDAGLPGKLPNVIVFQFNPAQVTRRPALARPPVRGDGAGQRPAAQQPDQPSESISFTLRLDATEQLAQGNPIAVTSGILPTLSALELLLASKKPAADDLASLAGTKKPHQHPPARLPTVFFVWGAFRILPVGVRSLAITETEYDPRLNPVRAEVAVELDVLTPSQLGDARIALGAYTYTQSVKEVMAALNLANAAQLGFQTSVSLAL
jgi:hypothetical protein